MVEKTDKRARAALFRERLQQALATRAVSRSELARLTGADRSTITQVLNARDARLPGGQIVAVCAEVLGVSADWLLGLSAYPETAADVLSASVRVSHAPRTPADEQLSAWHAEARGYKIRHVPAFLPDMLKTRAMLRWEYAPHLGKTTGQAIVASADWLEWMRGSGSDYEIALPLYELASFVQGTGYYEGLPLEVRLEQVDHMLFLLDVLYPRLRIVLFDARRLFSAPLTVFGPLMAVLYVGRNYLAFRDPERIGTLVGHFDRLVREASVSDRDLPAHLAALRAEVAGG